ncbi:hypothetical protein POTOM_057224 [Populus tomentosa]|uniref:Uncharacterized protein n=1 Tax=Populus tomentosa TaxID=118781 RepID=A0A8X7XZB1_POPTO|nr:hypothetical protein POTOM_057224 [Populus tomentosa]
MAFDKTGTITRGEFVVTDFQHLCDDISLYTLLYWVSSIESKSSHPMAAALVDYGRWHSVEPKPDDVEEFQNFPRGIQGKIECQQLKAIRRQERLFDVYYGATLAGIFSFSDSCRTGVAQAIKELKSLGIRTAMLTGDSEAAAMYAQEQVKLLSKTGTITRGEFVVTDFQHICIDNRKIAHRASGTGTYVAYNDENGGVIKSLKEDGIVDLDTVFSSLPEWISMKAMVSTWLADAIMHELWVGSDGTSARTIYHSGLPWLIGKALLKTTTETSGPRP